MATARAAAVFPAGVWPGGSLPAILERWLYVETVTSAPKRLQGAVKGDEPTRIEGIVRGPETVGDSGADIDALIGKGGQKLLDGIARSMREATYRDAESAIEAAQEAGWRLAEHPDIRVGGTLGRDRDTAVYVPCTEVRVALTFVRAVPEVGASPGLWTLEQGQLAAAYGTCLCCGAPRKGRIEKIGPDTFGQSVACLNGHGEGVC